MINFTNYYNGIFFGFVVWLFFWEGEDMFVFVSDTALIVRRNYF